MTTPRPLTCPNCGAPLKNDYECAYCGTRFHTDPGFVRVPHGSTIDYYYGSTAYAIRWPIRDGRGYPPHWDTPPWQ